MRYLKPNDGGAAEVMFAAYADRPDLPPREAFAQYLRALEMVYLMCDEEKMGAASRCAGRVHVGVLPAWRRRWATRGLIKAILDWAAVDGVVKTAAITPAGIRLIEGTGFKKEKDHYVFTSAQRS